MKHPFLLPRCYARRLGDLGFAVETQRNKIVSFWVGYDEPTVFAFETMGQPWVSCSFSIQPILRIFPGRGFTHQLNQPTLYQCPGPEHRGNHLHELHQDLVTC